MYSTDIVSVYPQVDALIHQVAEENGLEMIEQMEAVKPGTSSLKETGERSQTKEDNLSKRYTLNACVYQA